MNLTEIILPIMKNAAKIMLSAHDSEQGVNVLSKSGDANFVTVYDKATQDYLIDNITAAIPNAKFVAEATRAGLVSLKGHRVTGGMRASIYNAMPIEGVRALIDFMKKFEMENRL